MDDLARTSAVREMRFVSWRLILVHMQHVINVDLTQPAKELAILVVKITFKNKLIFIFIISFPYFYFFITYLPILIYTLINTGLSCTTKICPAGQYCRTINGVPTCTDTSSNLGEQISIELLLIFFFLLLLLFLHAPSIFHSSLLANNNIYIAIFYFF